MFSRLTQRTLILLFSTLALTASVSSTKPLASSNTLSQRSLRVLFIGNSYTLYNDLPWVTQQLALSAHEAKPMQTETVAMMGATLQEHWNDGRALQKLQQGGPWDYVILQEQSMMSLEHPEEMREYARLFDKEIKRIGARTILFVPWAHREHPEQQASIIEAYTSLARELDVTIAPVGAAWQNALQADSQLTLSRADADSHPNAAGSYLAACTLYAIMYGKSPEGVSASITNKGMVRHEFEPLNQSIKEEPFTLNSSDARLLQQTAWRVVQGR